MPAQTTEGGRGIRFVSPAALPPPHATASARKYPVIIKRKGAAPLKGPMAFEIKHFAIGLQSPRNILAAPNGDVFVTESYQGRIRLLRDTDDSGVVDKYYTFASGLKLPYGLALYNGYLYVGNTNAIVRFRYKPGQTRAAGKPEVVVSGIPSKGYRQHWTRNIAFGPDGKLYVSCGSETDKDPEKPPRATIFVCNPDGSDRRTFATGLRNPVGLAFEPKSNLLWATCVERDYYGDDLVPDFVTRVEDGDFFGWPWFYIGNNRDPHLKGEPAPRKPVKVPDVLVTAHSVPLGLLFYSGNQFPSEYRGDAFVAMRGSTNRQEMSGYKIVRIRFDERGNPLKGYQDFISGWCPDPSKRNVYGRPVGLAEWTDGSLLVTDEGAHRIYRISYKGSR